MAPSITLKRIGRQTYYYARECQRVNGRPKIVWQKYLGRAEDVVSAVLAPASPIEAELAELGASAALFDLAEEIGLRDLVDRHVGRRRRGGISVGSYMLLAALNRAIAPSSKRRLASWHADSVLRRLLPARRPQLDSRRFWDAMSALDAPTILAIERDLVANVTERFHIDTSCLLYDATNFFTFIDSFNDACALPQRGHSKEHRADLRIVGLALLVTRHFHVPLLHATYPGNRTDAPQFASVTEELVARFEALSRGVERITLVFDKGNNSEENIRALDGTSYHFVGSLPPSQHPKLLDIPRSEFRPASHPRLPGVLLCRRTYTVFGQPRTVIVTFNPKLHQAQARTIARETSKRMLTLYDLSERLTARRTAPRRGRLRSLASVRREVERILKGQHMASLIHAAPRQTRSGPRLDFHLCIDAWDNLNERLLGKTIIFTDNDDWSDEEIVLAYRSQYHVEESFKRMKDPHFLSFRPLFHWTDGKIRVHAFYCVLALLLVSLLHKRVCDAGLPLSIPQLLRSLRDIREVVLLYPPRRGKPVPPHLTLKRMDDTQRRLFELLGLAKHHAPPSA